MISQLMKLKNTEIVKASTNKTDELLEYFIMTKASEKNCHEIQ